MTVIGGTEITAALSEALQRPVRWETECGNPAMMGA